MHKQALYRTLKKLLPIVYGSATIPQSRLTAEFFDNLKAAAKAGKIFGPRAAQAQADERQVLYYHSDHLGSTRLITLQSGEVYQYLNYLPFGKALEGYQQSSYILPGWAQSKRSFTGQEIDRTTGLMFYQSRFYDPDLGRFTQADSVVPSATDSQSFNRFAYVYNNPFKFADPSGHDPLGAFIKGVIETLIVIAFTVIGFMIGGPPGAVAGFMIGSGLVAGYNAYEAGARSTSDIIGAGITGAVAAGFAIAVPALGYAMLAYNIYQAINENDMDALAEIAGGLATGVFLGHYGVPTSPRSLGAKPALTFGVKQALIDARDAYSMMFGGFLGGSGGGGERIPSKTEYYAAEWAAFGVDVIMPTLQALRYPVTVAEIIGAGLDYVDSETGGLVTVLMMESPTAGFQMAMETASAALAIKTEVAVSSVSISKADLQMADIVSNPKLFRAYIKSNYSNTRIANPLSSTEAQWVVDNARGLGIEVRWTEASINGLETTASWSGVPHIHLGAGSQIHVPVPKGFTP